jgi:hypothetical protein
MRLRYVRSLILLFQLFGDGLFSSSTHFCADTTESGAEAVRSGAFEGSHAQHYSFCHAAAIFSFFALVS